MQMFGLDHTRRRKEVNGYLYPDSESPMRHHRGRLMEVEGVTDLSTASGEAINDILHERESNLGESPL